jgi:hypothetical protein
VNTEEVAKFFLMARTAFSAQKFAEHTPDLWAEQFADYSYEDMRAALLWCDENREWLSNKDLIFHVKQARAKRIGQKIPELYPPADLDPDDAGAYLRWLAKEIKALGDGEVPEAPKNLVQRNVRELMAGLGELPDADTEEAS